MKRSLPRIATAAASMSGFLAAAADLMTPVLSFSKYLLWIAIALVIYLLVLSVRFKTSGALIDKRAGFSGIPRVARFYQEHWRAGAVSGALTVLLVTLGGYYLNQQDETRGYLASEFEVLGRIQNDLQSVLERLGAIEKSQDTIAAGIERLTAGNLSTDEVMRRVRALSGMEKVNFIRDGNSIWLVDRGYFSLSDLEVILQDIPEGPLSEWAYMIWLGRCEMHSMGMEDYARLVANRVNGEHHRVKISMLDERSCLKLPASPEAIGDVFRHSAEGLSLLFEYGLSQPICAKPLRAQDLPSTTHNPDYDGWAWENVKKYGVRAMCLDAGAQAELDRRIARRL